MELYSSNPCCARVNCILNAQGTFLLKDYLRSKTWLLQVCDKIFWFFWDRICFILNELKFFLNSLICYVSPPSSVGKESACNAGDLGSSPGSRRSPGEGNGNPLQFSCLENPMDKGAWRATVHGVARVGHDLVTKQRQQRGGSKKGQKPDVNLLWLSW